MFRSTLWFAMLFLAGFFLKAQVNVNYGSASFGACEVVEAAIGNSGQTLFLDISEIDGDNPELLSENTERPEFYHLLLEVELPAGLPFPITSELENEVTVSLSGLSAGLQENAFLESQLEARDFESQRAARAAATHSTATLEERMREVAMKMATGELSPEEGGRQIEALSQQAESIISSVPGVPDFEEMEDRANYSIIFYDHKENIAYQPFEGQLHISRFTETEFVATYTGTHVAQCQEVRQINASDNADECNQLRSSILPETMVYAEGPVSLSIQVKLKEFNDYR
ncbi:MAG: hypothetical protein AAFY36_07640 [Bacteroidota bacterium]